jgi:hypothetical protein
MTPTTVKPETLNEILAQVRPQLPAEPRIAELYGYPFIDSLGDPAVRVTVVFAEDFGKEGPDWSQLKPIQDAIFQVLRDRGIEDFPYVRFVTSRELAANPDAR